MNSSKKPAVDFYFEQNEKWQQEIIALREIILACNLQEELKWGCPCYTYNKNNVVLIHVFKNYCAILFFKGALLKDEEQLLVRQSANVQATRQMRFTNIKEIQSLKKSIAATLFEAIEVEKSGIKVVLKSTKDYAVPEEFAGLLKTEKSLKKNFEALSPGRQRAYLLYFSSAKQAKTRIERIKKYLPKINAGKGIDD